MSKNYNWNSDDIKKIEKLIEIKNRGYYANGKDVTDIYNRVLDKTLTPTNCGSCIKQRICELEKALNAFKKQMELSGFTDVNMYINELNGINEEIAEIGEQIADSTDKIGSAVKVNKPKGRPKAKK